MPYFRRPDSACSRTRSRLAPGRTAPRSTGRCSPPRWGSPSYRFCSSFSVPAASLRRADLRDALNRARTGGVHGRGGRLERGLVIAEVALAMLIAMGAALLVRSVANRYAIKPGVETKGIAVVDAIGSAELNPRQRRQAIDEITAALAAMPGARSAAAAMLLPLRSESNSFDIIVEGHEDRASSFTFFRIVTPSYFSTMGITLLSGRGFQSSDKPDTVEMSVIINDALAKKYFPGENPIGRRLHGGFGTPQRIIGVVSNVAEGKLTSEAVPARYYSGDQVPWFGTTGNVSFAIRTTQARDDAAILDAARRTIQRVAPTYAIEGTTTMARIFDAAIGPARQVMSLLTLLSALALLLGGKCWRVWSNLSFRGATKARLGHSRRARTAGLGRRHAHCAAGRDAGRGGDHHRRTWHPRGGHDDC